MTFIPISANNSYFAFGKQTVQGTAVAPTYFPRFEDGSGIDINTKSEEIWEGDTSPFLSMVIKNGQMVKLKFLSYLRPVELGFFLQAMDGIGSDNWNSGTSPTASTTLHGATLVGATSIATHANTGLTGSGTIALVLDPGLSTEEEAVFTIPATGSADPYTLTVANSGTLKYAHADAATVKSAAIHVFTRQYDGPYITSEVCLGQLHSQAGETLRVRDCKVNSVKVTGEKGKLWMHEFEIDGIATVVQGSPSTVTLENRQPFIFYNSVFTLDGSTSGDALGIDKVAIERKNNLDDGIQTTAVTPAAIIFGKSETKITLNLIMQNLNQFNKMYFGSTAGTTDSNVIAVGSFLVVLTQADSFHILQYNVTTVAYTLVKAPTPKTDGKHYEMSVESVGTSNMGLNASVLTTTLNNAQYAAY